MISPLPENRNWNSAEIRQAFFDFFKSKEHHIVPSSPVVLPTDPTLLFTNAGMNQFKEIFLGARQSEDKRVADTQKCIRVSGKHNDLEEVGHDTYHHTFFEMLGNWSFGDYYKKEAISWAWELMTGVWKLPKDRLWATVYRDDDEAAELWASVTDIDPSHILRFDEKDNFWEMGETGPCGPCSEIHIDLTEQGCGPELVNAGVPECIEIWNLVFIQYNRKANGQLEELPYKHVDTGMGFERVTAVLQGKSSNYDTDLFTPLLEKLAEMSRKAYEGESAIAMRVIADHIRTLTIAIGDGVMPSNDGRGYVLRRLLRRAVRYGRKLGFEKPFMTELVPVLQQVLGDVFPEIVQRGNEITRAIKAEEESFAQTLDRGISLFEDVVNRVKDAGETVFPGEDAFKLYDTYGFPADLTRLMAAEEGLSVDEEQFETCMAAQRERARAARKSKGISGEGDLVSALVKEGVKSSFVGYEFDSLETGVVKAIADGQVVDVLGEGMEGILMLEVTPFYAESGGQVGDQGFIRSTTGAFEVYDTQRPADGLILHIGKVIQGELKTGDKVSAEIDNRRRRRLEKHHSATHLLNAALREFVSENVKQAGSLVAPDRLRFDFTHYEAVSPDQLEKIERRVNEWVMQDDGVSTYEMAFKDVPGSGITAVFDEKYGDVVRVVDIAGYSRELCGGCHAARTGELGAFRIVHETSVAAGVRRIEAVCGWPAFEWTRNEHRLVSGLAQRFSVPQDQLESRISALLEQNKAFEKQLREVAAQQALGQADSLLEAVREIASIPVLAQVVEGQGMDGLRQVLDGLRPKLESGVIVLGSAEGGKASFIASVSKDLVDKGLHAGKLIGQVAKIAGGGGGGQPHKAQAGGKMPEKVPEAIAGVESIITSALS